MTATPTIILQGIDLAQHFDLLKQAVREVLAEGKQATELASEAEALPEEMPAAQAAKFCGYKTGKSLVKYHHTDLKPLRVNGKRIFYRKSEVLKLKKKLFNQ